MSTARYRTPAELDSLIPRSLVSLTTPDDEPPWPVEAAQNTERARSIDAVPNSARVRNLDPGIESRAAIQYPTTSIDAFLREPEPDVDMLVEGLGLAAVSSNILAGPPKSLKTLGALQLGLCVSTVDEEGNWLPFLGYPIARGGPVLFIEEEGGRHPLRRRLERQAAGLGATPAIEFVLFAGIRLDEEPSYRRLLATATYHQPALLVLDPFGFLHGSDENKPSAMAPIMRRLSRLANEAETCVITIHHVTKPQADRPAGRLGDRNRGASSITAGVDGSYLLDRKGGDTARLRASFRDHEPIDVTVELDPETLLLHRIEATKAATKIDPDDLAAYITTRHRVTALETAKHFDVRSKETARTALEALEGVDWHDDGPRGQRVYFMEGTAQ